MQLYSGTHAPGPSAEPRTRRFMEVWLLSLFRAEMFSNLCIMTLLEEIW